MLSLIGQIGHHLGGGGSNSLPPKKQVNFFPIQPVINAQLNRSNWASFGGVKFTPPQKTGEFLSNSTSN